MERKRNIEQTMKRLASALLIAFGALCLGAGIGMKVLSAKS